MALLLVLLSLGSGLLIGWLAGRRGPGEGPGRPEADQHEGGDRDLADAVLDMVPLGVVVADGSGKPVLRNTAADAIVDSWLDGVVGRLVGERLADAASGEASDEQVRTPGPPVRVLEVVARPLGPPGSEAGAVAILEDVTERNRQESVRRDFVANVSHELKTPIGALSLLAETLPGETDPEVVARLAARIEAESQRVGSMIEDLLDLSRIEGEPSDRVGLVDLAHLVEEVVERLLPMADQRGVSVHVNLAGPPGDVAVHGIRSQLLSMVRNLVENAVKYSDQGGQVEVEVGVAGGEGVGVVQVSDTGIGIPARDLERVFERFYRVDRARNRETGGTGLGLSIVRNVAHGHGGRVELESEEGMGTTVTVRIPVNGGPGA